MTGPTFAHVKRLEGLAHSLKVARDRKRKGLTIHPDEIPELLAALEPAIALLDARRIAGLQARRGTDAENPVARCPRCKITVFKSSDATNDYCTDCQRHAPAAEPVG